jgi:hypothetical protein
MIKFWTLVFTTVLVETFSGLRFIDMSSLSTEFIDVCARQLGGKRLHVKFSWEDTQFEQFLTKKPRQILRAPDGSTSQRMMLHGEIQFQNQHV